MKLKFKKYVYLLNDITNQLLKKDREDLREQVKGLRRLAIILSIALAISLLTNITFLWLAT